MPKSKSTQTGITVQLTGQNGNIFSIMGRVQRAMNLGGFRDEAKELVAKVTSSRSYPDALDIIADYVEVE